jgi:asparagine synthase (glutamine-hydrolysing)
LLRAESPPFSSLASDPLAAHLAWAHVLSPARADLFRDPRAYQRGIEPLLDHFRRAVRDGSDIDNPQPDPLNEILLADLFVGLPGDMLRKVDLASMRYGLEVRVPFLDPTVVEFAAAMPSAFKLADGRGKRILIDAYRGLIPDDILHRRKMGFELPVGEWLRGPLHDFFRDTVTRDVIESCELIDYAAVERAFDDHRNRRADHSELLFSLLSLCRWWQK